MPIYWRLKEYLETVDTTAYRLSVESGVRLQSIHAMMRRRTAVEKLDSAAIDKILLGLSALTGETVTHEHILRFVPPEAR